MPLGSPKDIESLIEDGIQIVESIQAGQIKQKESEHPRERAGKNNQLPESPEFSTKHADAPEAAKDGNPKPSTRGGADKKNDNQKTGEEALSDDRPNGSADGGERRAGSGGNNSVRDAQDYGGDCSSSGRCGPLGLQDGIGHRRAEPMGADEHAPGDICSEKYSALDNSQINLDDLAESQDQTDAEEKNQNVVAAAKDDVMRSLMEPPGAGMRRLRGIQDYEETVFVHDHGGKVVKRGIEESTGSMKIQVRYSSTRGATPSVLPLDLNQPKRSVDVDTAQSPVEDVQMTPSLDSMDLESTLVSKLDQILENQEQILIKLKLVAEMKQEIGDIKKILTTHGVAMSTIEGYISSLMIVIPGSGKPDSESPRDTNPDLRPILGRDNSRGIHEVAKLDISLDECKIKSKTVQGDPMELEEEYTHKPLDFTKNNAANFVPTNSNISLKVVEGIIDDRASSINEAESIKKWLHSQLGNYDLKDLYAMILDILDIN